MIGQSEKSGIEIESEYQLTGYPVHTHQCTSVYEIAALAKGQLILEWLFDVSNFPKRLNNADEFLPQNLEIGWIGKIKAQAI